MEPWYELFDAADQAVRSGVLTERLRDAVARIREIAPWMDTPE